MDTKVIRLQGDMTVALPSWDSAIMIPILTEIGKLWDARGEGTERQQDDRFATMQVARAVAWRQFALTNGWATGRVAYDPRRLVHTHARFVFYPSWVTDDTYDHPYSILPARGCKPLGVVIHLYGPINLSALPSDSIIVDKLPASWYSPWTTAYLLRPGPRPKGKYPGKQLREAVQ